jgi:hypothetical protein
VYIPNFSHCGCFWKGPKKKSDAFPPNQLSNWAPRKQLTSSLITIIPLLCFYHLWVLSAKFMTALIMGWLCLCMRRNWKNSNELWNENNDASRWDNLLCVSVLPDVVLVISMQFTRLLHAKRYRIFEMYRQFTHTAASIFRAEDANKRPLRKFGTFLQRTRRGISCNGNFRIHFSCAVAKYWSVYHSINKVHMEHPKIFAEISIK